ncbi:MAG: YabP/YqfC family sporulation protein [Firmicutes bacterium]|nr:YabP/YqfC family sporulation protein [Bacillota bacterium]
MEQTSAPQKPHAVSLENREKGTVSGVSKVVSACDSALVLETGQGGLSITGSGIKIARYDDQTGMLAFEGAITSLKYSGAKMPLLKRMFS